MFFSRLVHKTAWSGRRIALGMSTLTLGYYLYRRDPIRLDSDEPPLRQHGSPPSISAQSFTVPLSKLQEKKSVKSFLDSPISIDQELRKHEQTYTPGLGGISRIDIVQFAWYYTHSDPLRHSHAC